MLCGISTDRINKMGKGEPLVIEDVEVKYPIFVDDIAAMGKKKHIEEMAEKMKILETFISFCILLYRHQLAKLFFQL